MSKRFIRKFYLKEIMKLERLSSKESIIRRNLNKYKEILMLRRVERGFWSKQIIKWKIYNS